MHTKFTCRTRLHNIIQMGDMVGMHNGRILILTMMFGTFTQHSFEIGAI